MAASDRRNPTRQQGTRQEFLRRQRTVRAPARQPDRSHGRPIAHRPKAVALDGRRRWCYKMLNPTVVTLTCYAEVLGKEVVVSFR